MSKLDDLEKAADDAENVATSAERSNSSDAATKRAAAIGARESYRAAASAAMTGGTATAKNLLIEVPDFDTVMVGDQVSYVRLGKFLAADVDPTNTTRGGDLVQYANTVGPGEGWGVAAAGQSAVFPGNRLFEDDWRNRLGDPSYVEADKANPYKTDTKWAAKSNDPAAAGHLIPKDIRKDRSAKLLDKASPSAGWRDHTEGNRVTTTRGDKVEVIGGNYKLVVLGRNVDPTQSSGFDFSGGHVQDFDAAPGTINEIKWVKDQGGTWKIYEKATKGELATFYQGNVYEAFNGSVIKSYTGADEADLPDELKGGDHMRGSVTGKPSVSEFSRLKSYSSDVKVLSSYGGDGVHSSATEATVFKDSVHAHEVKTTTEFGLMFTEMAMGPMHFVLDLSALRIEISTGAQVKCSVGGVAELAIGIVSNATIGGVFNVIVGTRREAIVGSNESYFPRETKFVGASAVTAVTAQVAAAASSTTAATISQTATGTLAQTAPAVAITSANTNIGVGGPPPPPPPTPPPQALPPAPRPAPRPRTWSLSDL